MNDYLSIKEFADAAGISQQAVYKQLSGRLKPYIKKVKGKNKIDAAALKEFYETESSTKVEEVEQPISTPEKQPFQPKVEEVQQPKSTQENEFEKKLKSLEDRIDEVLKSKQEEIEFLRQQLIQKDKTIENLTENLKIEKQLALADKKRILELEDTLKQQEEDTVIYNAENNEEIIEPAAAAATSDKPEETKIEDVAEEKQTKVSFWQRLFKRG